MIEEKVAGLSNESPAKTNKRPNLQNPKPKTSLNPQSLSVPEKLKFGICNSKKLFRFRKFRVSGVPKVCY